MQKLLGKGNIGNSGFADVGGWGPFIKFFLRPCKTLAHLCVRGFAIYHIKSRLNNFNQFKMKKKIK